MLFTLSGSIFLNLNTPVWEQNGKKPLPVWEQRSKITIVVLSGSKNLKSVYPFRSIIAEKDTQLGSKNGENDTLSSGTYPVPSTSKCPTRVRHRQIISRVWQTCSSNIPQHFFLKSCLLHNNILPCRLCSRTL